MSMMGRTVPPLMSFPGNVGACLQVIPRKIRIAISLTLSSNWRILSDPTISTSAHRRVVSILFTYQQFIYWGTVISTCDLRELRYPYYSHSKPFHPTAPAYRKGALFLMDGRENQGPGELWSHVRPLPRSQQKIAGDSSFSSQLDGFAFSCLEQVAHLVLRLKLIGEWGKLSCLRRHHWAGVGWGSLNPPLY